jgi:ABC-type lipoprotein release transport system permease subunit
MAMGRTTVIIVAQVAVLLIHIERTPALEAQLLAVPHVKAITPRLTFQGLLTNGSRGTVSIITAIDPAGFITQFIIDFRQILARAGDTRHGTRALHAFC